MNLIYLSYWGVEEGLTQSSVLPHLKILVKMAEVRSVYFFTVERYGKVAEQELEGVHHIPVYSKNIKPGVANKINDFLLVRKAILDLTIRVELQLMICRSALAGAIGYLVYKKIRTPFIVESFEPHADYMLEAGVWNRFGLKYLFQKYWEKKVLKHASSIVAVSRHYADFISSKRASQVYTFGCAVDLVAFSYDQSQREVIRNALGFQECLIGIYVGKFGDIYYDDKAFIIFKRAFDYFGSRFRLIILTSNNKESVYFKIDSVSINRLNVYVGKVPHHDVPYYLNAADFAFSMVKPSPFRKFCSPIKDGEYWANGLPILMGHGIGEDSEIIRAEGGGALFKDDLSDLEEAFAQLGIYLDIDRKKGIACHLAKKYRGFERLTGIYQQVLSQFQK